MLVERLPAPQRRAARAGVPYRAHVIVTHVCNLSCVHCYQAEHGGPELSLSELERAFDELADLGTLFLTLGGGEPLARGDFWEVLAAARKRRFAVEVYTNGMLVDAEAARRFRDAGVVRVDLSLHGAHAETHDAFVRRPGAFDRINRAIDHLEAAGVPVGVKSNLVATNLREAPELEARFAHRPLVQVRTSRTIHPRDDGDAEPLRFLMSEAQEREVVRGELSRQSDESLRRILDGARRAQATDAAEIVACQAARTGLAIHPAGDVTPCTQTAGLVMGNVRQRPLREIWLDSGVARKFRQLDADSFEDCSACPYRKVCNHCAALSLSESGSLTGFSSQVCRSTRVYWSEVERRAAELGETSPFGADAEANARQVASRSGLRLPVVTTHR